MNDVDKETKDEWKKHLPYLEMLAKTNNSGVFLIGHKDGSDNEYEFLYTSPNFATIYGYDPLILDNPKLDVRYLENQLHPDDRAEFRAIQEKLLVYIHSLPKEECLHYKHIYEFRVLNAEKKYVRVISQHQPLEVNADNSIAYVLGIADLTPNQNQNDSVKFRLLNTKTGEFIKFPFENESEIKLSKRELEILSLMHEGLLSKEISDKLNISIHTVNGHRQNILQKLNVDNTQEAINTARKLRLIE